MAPRSYLPHVGGELIVSLPATGGAFASTLTISDAEHVLELHRANAWTWAEMGSRTLANSALERVNDLADALAVAAEQRAKEAALTERKAA